MSTQPFTRAERIASVEVSEIVRIAEAARARRAAGEDVIGLSTGEPDFDTPEHIKAAAERAMRDNDTHYPPTAGTVEMKAAIARKFERENDLRFEPREIIVSTGAKQVLFNAFMATLNPGDEILVPTPFWTSYGDMIRITGARLVPLPCTQAQGFRLTPEALREAITPRTRWLLLNSPNNPSGAAYDADDYRALAAVLAEHPQVWVAADEIYEHLVYGDFTFTAFRAAVADSAPDVAARTLTVNGVSKAYAMTGWRLGYGAGDADLIAAMTAVQGQVTSGASTISQAAAVAALDGPQDTVRTFRESFRLRRDSIVAALNQCPGLDCPTPEGAFYVFPSCADLIGSRAPDGTVIDSDTAFCHYVLAAAGVAMVPGRPFGGPGHFRISYATAPDLLEDAGRRIAAACAELHR